MHQANGAGVWPDYSDAVFSGSCKPITKHELRVANIALCCPSHVFEYACVNARGMLSNENLLHISRQHATMRMADFYMEHGIDPGDPGSLE